MKRITACLVLAACSLSCSASKPAGPIADAPLVEEVEVEVEVDREGAREVLEQFLEARWSFDREAALAYVTAEDAERPWGWAIDHWIEVMNVLGHNRDWREWYSWRILELEPGEKGNARAIVEVIYPTAPAIVGNLTRTNIERTQVMTKVRDPMKIPMVMQKTTTAFEPTRFIRRMNYELVHDEAGEWKVWMDWKSLPAEVEEPIDLSRFNGSERAWAMEARRGHEQNPTERAEHRELANAARKAERDALDRDYDEALRQYDELMMNEKVPDLIASRTTVLAEAKEAWAARKAEANIAFAPGDAQRDGDRFRYPIDVTNNGKRKINWFRARVYFATPKQSDGQNVTVRNIASGETKATKAWLYAEKAAPVDRIEVVAIAFDGESSDPTRKRDHEYEWALQDYERGYVSTYDATRVATAVRALEDELYACDGWPDEPIDLRIDITAEGRVDAASVADIEALAKCIETKLGSLEFPETEEPWGAVIQLFPKNYWEKLGARAPR